MIKIRSKYDGSRSAINDVLVQDKKNDKTQQQFKNECDINTILKRAQLGQILLPQPDPRKLAVDFTKAKSLKETLDIVRDAEAMFMQLPAKLRERFRNNAAELIDFVSKPVNLNEAIELGLVERPKTNPKVPAGTSGSAPQQSTQSGNGTAGAAAKT